MSGVEITEEKFREFVKIQESGSCNMIDYGSIRLITTLTREEHKEIIVNYKLYAEAHDILLPVEMWPKLNKLGSSLINKFKKEKG